MRLEQFQNATNNLPSVPTGTKTIESNALAIGGTGKALNGL